ncbi:MAG: tetratricopeptide repeat protein [Verrucomicrobia bacterium]|nr:tetratricopeptide repeat protein [Verrucomicrobiota bacterium]
MSRFNNLELGDQHQAQSSSRPPLKDEQHFLDDSRSAFARGQFEQALRSYAKVLEFNPQNAMAWTGQVRMLIELREFREAKLWADKALESFPEDAELLAAKAVALARTGDVKAALAFSDAAIAVHGDTPYVWLARGDVLLARKEKRAAFCFEKALTLARSDWLFHWLASRVHYFYNQFSRALKLAQQALALDAGQAVLWLQFGRCQLALGLLDAASNSFDQARELNLHCVRAEDEVSQIAADSLWSRLCGRWRQWFQR